MHVSNLSVSTKSSGIVPYVDPPSTGSIAGIVGAGGNTGAVCFGLGFRNLDYKDAFILMGCVILGSVVPTAFIYIKGHSAMFCGQEDVIEETADKGVLAVPVQNEKALAEIDDEIDC